MSNDNKELIEKLEKELEPSKNQINTEILEKAVNKGLTEEQIKLKGLRDFYNLRNTWSWIIGVSISFLLTS